MFCTKCGTQNHEGAVFCANCGQKLLIEPSSAIEPPAPAVRPTEPALDPFAARSAPPAASSPDEAVELWAAVIGPKNTSSYLNDFVDADKTGRIPKDWHWPAFWVTWYWLPYRKMWLNWVLYWVGSIVGGALIGFAIGFFGAVSGINEDTLQAVTILVVIALIFVLPGLYARGILFKHYKGLIDRAKLMFKSHDQRLQFLREKGGTSNLAWILISVFIVITMIGIMAAIALPAYHDYTKRAKVSELMLSGSSLKAEIQEKYNATGVYDPDDYRELNGAMGEVKAIDRGLILFTMGPAMAEDAGKQFVMMPILDGGKIVRWNCGRLSAPAKYMPQSCREDANKW